MSDEHPTAATARRDPRLVTLEQDSGYQVHERIGAGGMGIVYRAHDADGNEVAIKLLRHDIADDPRARERLAREVGAQRLVHNDNIVRILDAELESADAFVVTEFVPGPTLEDAVRSVGGLHPELVRELGIVLAESLEDIHAAGVVHRDLKPSNVLLRGARDEDLQGYDPEGYGLDPVIIDFGIAVAAEESRLTSTGLVMGTAAYLDPEVMRSNRTGETGDWWALAAMLAFAATGREPFGSGRADLVLLRAERGEIDVDGVPVELGQWFRDALRSEPEDRPSPRELRERLDRLDLDRYAHEGATEAIPAGTAGAGAATAAAGAGAAAGSAAAADPPTEALPATDGEDTPPAGSDRTEVLSAGPRTDSTRPQETGAAGAAAADPDRTEALPAARQDPATEVIPVAQNPTKAMPVIRDEDEPQGGPVHRQPAPAPAPAPQQEPPTERMAPVASAPPQQAQDAQDSQRMQPWAPSAQQPTGSEQAGQGLANPYGDWQQPPAPRRRIIVWIGHLIIVALAAVAPYVSLALLLVFGALARTWEKSHRTVLARRSRGSSSSGASTAAGFAAPFRFLLGLVVTALQALLPLILGLLIGLGVVAAFDLVQHTQLPDAVPFAIAMAVTLLLVWVGIGARTTRDGAHRIVEAATPDLVWSLVVGVLLVLLLGAIVSVIVARGGATDYMPFYQWPTISQIAFWR
ncbi:serine/threonine protein kinase [Brachybacterium endophyticum]|uniref:Serine/threonine protein kinase n=1 Tax=Brachybacterium endophyticum TaxID=2182385 RepID=A0A2U2RPY4_9MICO|nr:serine/threonine-protein kinase [Brachybacterium endophyticum]PWH07932.1 serine/threonine protein kinase [Brachybacterium endophyticum]